MKALKLLIIVSFISFSLTAQVKTIVEVADHFQQCSTQIIGQTSPCLIIKEGAVITVGMINAGIRSNIIPEKATIVGTIRTLDYGMQDFINKRMDSVVEVKQAILTFRQHTFVKYDK